MRGLHVPYVSPSNKMRITPAHAGTTTFCLLTRSASQDHPRPRGDYSMLSPLPYKALGSPPPTRGLPCNSVFVTVTRRITPAHAGTTFFSSSIIKSPQDHPRTRGDYELSLVRTEARRGSPPHTRGLLFMLCPPVVIPRITPAHAGTTGKNL